MDTLQTLACICYLEHSKPQMRIPFNIPGSVDSWIIAWMDYTGFEWDEDVVEMVKECLIQGKATRQRSFYPFRKRVEILCDSMGINRGPHERPNLSDTVILLDPGFVWKKKKVTRKMIESWGHFRYVDEI